MLLLRSLHGVGMWKIKIKCYITICKGNQWKFQTSCSWDVFPSFEIIELVLCFYFWELHELWGFLRCLPKLGMQSVSFPLPFSFWYQLQILTLFASKPISHGDDPFSFHRNFACCFSFHLTKHHLHLSTSAGLKPGWNSMILIQICHFDAAGSI